MHTNRCVPAWISFQSIRRTEVGRSLGNSVSVWERPQYTTFHSRDTGSQLHQWSARVPSSPQSYEHLLCSACLLAVLLSSSHPNACGVLSLLMLIWISLMMSDTEYLSVSLWPSVCPLWRNAYWNPSFLFPQAISGYWAVTCVLFQYPVDCSAIFPLATSICMCVPMGGTQAFINHFFDSTFTRTM